MKPTDFNFGSGRVVYWDFDDVSPDHSLEDQLRLLKEDLIQVSISTNILLDVGWYPEFSKNGGFVVLVVRNDDWEKPLLRVECRSIPALRVAITRGVAAALGTSS